MPRTYNEGGYPKITIVDCGLKFNQIRCFVKRGASVKVVPWNHTLDREDFDGLFISNGPGDPEMCIEIVANLKKLLASKQFLQNPKPIFGICMGHQILARAIGCSTYKMKLDTSYL